MTQPIYYLERVVLGPCRCQGCGQDVAFLVGHDHTPHGWLHPDGSVKCWRKLPAGLSRREYNRLWMRRKRAAA